MLYGTLEGAEVVPVCTWFLPLKNVELFRSILVVMASEAVITFEELEGTCLVVLEAVVCGSLERLVAVTTVADEPVASGLASVEAGPSVLEVVLCTAAAPLLMTLKLPWPLTSCKIKRKHSKGAHRCRRRRGSIVLLLFELVLW